MKSFKILTVITLADFQLQFQTITQSEEKKKQQSGGLLLSWASKSDFTFLQKSLIMEDFQRNDELQFSL